MKLEILLLVVGLLCSVDAFNVPGGPKSVDGIYDGRFGIEKNVQAVFNMGGVRGYVQFFERKPAEPVRITVNLQGLDQYPDAYQWRIHEYPVRYPLLEEFPCDESEVGGVFDVDDDAATMTGDLYARLGGIRNDMQVQTFVDDNITTCGACAIVGRTLRIDIGNQQFICANIEYHGARVERLRATFDFDNSEVQGDVIFTKVAGRDDATIEADLVRRQLVDEPFERFVTWGIYHGPCDDLGNLFGNETIRDRHHGLNPFEGCGPKTQRLCAIGDLTRKCGNLTFENDGRGRTFCTDNQLGSIPCSYLYDEKAGQETSLVLRDPDGTIIGCSRIGPPVPPQVATCTFHDYRFYGDFLFYQNSPVDRTHIKTYLTGVNGEDGYSLVIREGETPDDYNCDVLGPILGTGGPGEPFFPVPRGGVKTGDAGALGSLGGILDIENGESLRVKAVTYYVPLYGQCSVIGNSLVLVGPNGERVACCTITRTSQYSNQEIASLLGNQNLEFPQSG